MSHYKLYIQQICAVCIWARTWDICSKQIAENSFDITYSVTVGVSQERVYYVTVLKSWPVIGYTIDRCHLVLRYN